MIQRTLFEAAFSDVWGRQMRFITGPRQSGKTTLAQSKLAQEGSAKLYYLWDLRSVRNRYKKNQLFFSADSPPASRKQWVCFDEIHKIPKWKNALKAIFDSSSEHYQFIVTGSAKFDMFRKAGDSLSGRYFTFRLFPVCLAELANPNVPAKPPKSPQALILEKIDSKRDAGEALSQLLEFSGFPEPLLKQSKVFYAKWAEDYTDTVIKEDIGALTRIIDRDRLYDLFYLLPEMAGNPISESSLASHLEISNPTVKNYLKRLEDFYLGFKIHPYVKNIKRALLKSPKFYLYDWARIQDSGKRFENYVAVELLAKLSIWMNHSEDRYALHFIRNKEKEETDFVILKNKAPWLLIETKLSDGPLASHHYKTQAMLGGIPLLELCREEGVGQMEGKNVYRLSASRFLS